MEMQRFNFRNVVLENHKCMLPFLSMTFLFSQAEALKGATSQYFDLFLPWTKLPLN